MTKSDLIRIIDLLSFLVLVTMISTGALLEFTLPERSGPASVWGLTRHEWGSIHFYVSTSFLILMSVHLFLHLRYIKSAVVGKATREQAYRIGIGIVSLIVLLLLAFAPVISPVENADGPGSGRHHQFNR